ncbi:hypothetical protein [Paraburkholderia solisilvae]|uniref:hypothetical protein n=1 Tax=Paraburkholderia solisilvae TaxID=624376 RepID=UPI0015840460|nr:hypothetical protein [Paraburkholderia solisilvae]
MTKKTHDRQGESWLDMVLVGGGFALGLVLAVALVHTPGTSEEWASWATAVGTIGAVFAALYLATREDRRRRREALAVAKLTASSLTFRLAIANGETQNIYNQFSSMERNDGPPGRFEEAVRRLRSLDIGSHEDRIALIPLPNRCAYKLAGAHDRLHSSIKILEGMAAQPVALKDESIRKESAKRAAFVLQELPPLLHQISQQCQLISMSLTNHRWPHEFKNPVGDGSWGE